MDNNNIQKDINDNIKSLYQQENKLWDLFYSNNTNKTESLKILEQIRDIKKQL